MDQHWNCYPLQCFYFQLFSNVGIIQYSNDYGRGYRRDFRKLHTNVFDLEDTPYD